MGSFYHSISYIKTKNKIEELTLILLYLTLWKFALCPLIFRGYMLPINLEYNHCVNVVKIKIVIFEASMNEDNLGIQGRESTSTGSYIFSS